MYYVVHSAVAIYCPNKTVIVQCQFPQGLLMDFQPGLTKHGGCGDGCVDIDSVQNEYITAENVNQIFDKYGVPHEFDLLTIDIDYNDYWVWKSLLTREDDGEGQ
jgi:hypothetical protein